MDVRWIVRRDYLEVLDVDSRHGGTLTEASLLRHLRQRNVIGLVAEDGDHIQGYCLYELRHGELVLTHLAGTPDACAALLAKIAGKLLPHRRTSARCDVSQGDVWLHRALAAAGWDVDAIDNDADTYRFAYRIEVPADAGDFSCDLL